MLKYFIIGSTPSVGSLATGFFSAWSSSSGDTESSSSAYFGRSALNAGSFDGVGTGAAGTAETVDGAGYAT